MFRKLQEWTLKTIFLKQMMRYVEISIKERSRENTLDVVKVVGEDDEQSIEAESQRDGFLEAEDSYRKQQEVKCSKVVGEQMVWGLSHCLRGEELGLHPESNRKPSHALLK